MKRASNHAKWQIVRGSRLGFAAALLTTREFRALPKQTPLTRQLRCHPLPERERNKSAYSCKVFRQLLAIQKAPPIPLPAGERVAAKLTGEGSLIQQDPPQPLPQGEGLRSAFSVLSLIELCSKENQRKSRTKPLPLWEGLGRGLFLLRLFEPSTYIHFAFLLHDVNFSKTPNRNQPPCKPSPACPQPMASRPPPMISKAGLSPRARHP